MIADTSTFVDNKLNVLPDVHAVFEKDAKDIRRNFPDNGYGAVVICIILSTPGHMLNKFVSHKLVCIICKYFLFD